MKTIHLSDGIEVKRKKPKLKFDILECLALRGKVSKSGLKDRLKNRYYPDISNSVDELKRGEYIKVADRKQRRGKEQVYYTITEKGVKALLADRDFPAHRFWEILHGFCQNNDDLVMLDKVEEFYNIVMRRYLKYCDHGFFFQSGIFHNLCHNWFEETIFKSNKITTAQKVIETLAINPKITFEKLLEETRESESTVKQVLNSYSSISGSWDDWSVKRNNEEYADFLNHNIVITRQSNGDDNSKLAYSLSLFGIMLCLLLIRYKDMGMLKHGLYSRHFSVQQYYDKIASKYEEKLPLVFGKWNQLKGILREFTVYNFDIIVLNKDDIIGCNNANLLSVTMGGSKEFCDGIQTILLYNGKLMWDFVNAGWGVLEKYIHDVFRIPDVWKKSEFIKIYPLCTKFQDVIMLLNPTSFVYPSLGMFNFQTRHVSTILQKMEESFADEISAFYYMNLQNNFPVSTDESPNHSSKESLSLILEQDNEEPSIREWLSKWKDDLVTLQEEILQNTRAI